LTFLRIPISPLWLALLTLQRTSGEYLIQLLQGHF